MISIEDEKNKITQEIINLQNQLSQLEQARILLSTQILKRQGMIELLERMNGAKLPSAE